MVCPTSGLADTAGEFTPGSTVMTGGPDVGGKVPTTSLDGPPVAGFEGDGSTGADEAVAGAAGRAASEC